MADKKRLIDAAEAEKALFQLRKGYRKAEEKCAVGGCIVEIREVPTVDAVEVVRCKNCKHFDEHNSKCYVFCNNEHEVQLEVDRDHFCSYGERITDGA